jgi:Zn-dependent M16 (insulinase) family peptidase
MDSVADGGHRYALGVASRGLTPVAAVKEFVGGMTHVSFLNALVEKGEKGVGETREALQV